MCFNVFTYDLHVLKICVCRTFHWLLNKMKHLDRINAQVLSMPTTREGARREQFAVSNSLYSMACRVVNWDMLWMQLTH